jgi:predicted N-acyltransferase
MMSFQLIMASSLIICNHVLPVSAFQFNLQASGMRSGRTHTNDCNRNHKRKTAHYSQIQKTILSAKSNTNAYKHENVEYTLLNGVNLVPPSVWDNCLPTSNTNANEISTPFLQHSFLSALEASQCVSSQRGWLPRHLQISIDGQISAFVPLYIKSHSMGEFIFDSEWAEFAKQKGISYYPKLLIGVPFSPVTCPKILLNPSFRRERGMDEDREKLKEFRVFVGKIIESIVKDNHLSSAHINFVTEEEAIDLGGDLDLGQDEENGAMNKSKSILQSVVQKLTVKDSIYFRKTTLQYHWFNKHKTHGGAYSSFDDYLTCFKSKKRITIKRERRLVKEQNVRVDAIVGKEIRNYPGLVERMYEIYKSTVDKMFWGGLYFTKEFFEMLVDSDFVDNLVFMCARPYNFNLTDVDAGRDLDSNANFDGSDFVVEDVFAGTINVVQDNTFWGRYWGCLPSFEVKNLHFEVSNSKWRNHSIR